VRTLLPVALRFVPVPACTGVGLVCTGAVTGVAVQNHSLILCPRVPCVGHPWSWGCSG
jgi:hypothetical protein